MLTVKGSFFLFLFFALISSDLTGQNNTYTSNYNWPWSQFPRSSIAYSLEEALNRPLAIKALYVWEYDTALAKRIPELENLEVLTFGYYDMDYFCQAYEFPVEFCRLKHLRSIDIIQAIDPLPDSLFKMRSLRKLSTGNNEVHPVISLLDSLETFAGILPPFPWPGSFKGLKRIPYNRFSPEQIEHLSFIEEATLILEVDTQGLITNKKALEVFAQKKHLKKLSIYCVKPLNSNQIPIIFRYLDQLPSLEELAFESPTFTTKNAEPVKGKTSSLLKNIKRLSITSGTDLTPVLPMKFDNLKSFTVYINSTLAIYTSDLREIEIIISPESLASRISRLEMLSIRFSEDSHADSISKKWLSAFTTYHIQADSLFILSLRGWGYPHGYGYQHYYNRSNLPECETEILDLIGNQKNLLHLTVDGFKFKSLDALTEKISGIHMVRSIYLEVMALDGKPFDLSKLNNFQRTNWVLFFDELSTGSSSAYSKEPVKYKFWKLCSPDIPFNNLVERISWETSIYAESSIPLLPYNTDSLPVSLHLYHLNCEFSHPVIKIPAGHGEEEYPSCRFCDLPRAFYEEEKFSLFWNCDVRKDSRWKISPKQFKKGEKITIHDKINLSEQSISWYESGALKSMKQNIGGDVKEMKWTETGQPLYLIWEYQYTIVSKDYMDYYEAAWDTNGNMLWCRVYIKNRIAELRFYTDGHIKAKGWVVEGKPIGTWYFFDIAGNMTTANAPASLKVE